MKYRKNKKEEIKKPRVPRTPDVFLKNKDERTIRDFARVFYLLMKQTDLNKFYSGLDILKMLDDVGWSLHNNPHMLWRVWRQTEAEFPHAIEFIPQVSEYWTKCPSGWVYRGDPKYDEKKRKKYR